jgi:hypothetical protein
MSKKHYIDIGFLTEVWVENALVNLIDSQAIFKWLVDLRKPSKEDLFSTFSQVKMVNSWVKYCTFSDLKGEEKVHKWIICRNVLFPLNTEGKKWKAA